MLTIASEIAQCSVFHKQVENKLWLNVYFVYSDVISVEWRQCQVANSWPRGLLHMNIS